MPSSLMTSAKGEVMSNSRTKVTVPQMMARKSSGPALAMVTAYDATFAAIADGAGVDLILVGDSVATVMQGQKNTLGVSMEQMEYHVQMVAAARPLALIVGDLPFGSYQSGVTEAVTNSIRLIKAGAEIVKLEGGVHVADQIRAIAQADIPVMGHIGLTPQSYHRMGGNKVQGRTSGEGAGSRERLMEDAFAVEQSGACALVIEGVPAELAADITAKISIPTIGIGAGISCDGQVLVLHDILGLSPRTFTFAKKYADVLSVAQNALSEYVSEVQAGSWPDDEHSFK
jgi:3-methyl-2-oxobutanoate hydroxymethyltransferase